MKGKINLLLLIAGLIVSSQAAQAQTWDEWFSQGWAQHEYDRRQIYALWPLLNKVSEGLQVVGKGLTTISDITNGELNLHRNFFDSRTGVNPAVNNALDFIEVVWFQNSIIRQMKEVYERCRHDNNFSAEEILYIERVHRNFLVLTGANISELLKILRPGDLSMSDDERMEQLNRIYDDMKDQRAFVNAFDQEARMLSWERQHELNEANRTKSLYETF